MAVTSHTIPADLVAAVTAGDERAIERGFHEVFPTFLAMADAELHDKASAARVVERAFMETMASKPASADEFDRALSKAIHGSAVREQSRLAALRRFEHNEGVTHHDHRGDAVGAAQSWAHIVEARSRAAAGHAPVDHKEVQHVAAVHMAEAMKKDHRKWSIPLIIAAIVVLSVAGYGITKLDPRPSEEFVMAQLNATAARTINTPAGQEGNISLADGTVMRIGSGTQLKVVNNFADPLRAVLVRGAASFTFAPGDRPFELRGKNVAISANDGRVDIRADDDRPAIVRVVSGSPRLALGDSAWVAAPGQAIAFEGTTFRPATPQEIEEAFAWMDGRFVVSGTVRQVVDAIRRWYDMDVGIGDNSIADWPAKASGSLQSLTSTLASLESSVKVKAVWQNRQLLLFKK